MKIERAYEVEVVLGDIVAAVIGAMGSGVLYAMDQLVWSGIMALLAILLATVAIRVYRVANVKGDAS